MITEGRHLQFFGSVSKTKFGDSYETDFSLYSQNLLYYCIMGHFTCIQIFCTAATLIISCALSKNVIFNYELFRLRTKPSHTITFRICATKILAYENIDTFLFQSVLIKSGVL